MLTSHHTSVGAAARQMVALQAGIARHIDTRVSRAAELVDLGYTFQGALNGKPNVYFVFPPSPATGCYVVHLDGPEGQASCTCRDFEIHRIPCKHVAAVCFNKKKIDADTAAVREVLARHKGGA